MAGGDAGNSSTVDDACVPDDASALVASASMLIAPGTMVHIEGPRWVGTSESGRPVAGEAASAQTDIHVQVGSDAETVLVQVLLPWCGCKLVLPARVVCLSLLKAGTGLWLQSIRCYRC